MNDAMNQEITFDKLLVWALIGASIVLLCAGYMLSVNHVSYQQDAVSKSVIRVEYIAYFIPFKKRIIFKAKDYDDAKAIWETGVNFAFSKPLMISETVAVVCDNKKFMITFMGFSKNQNGKNIVGDFVVKSELGVDRVSSASSIHLGHCRLRWWHRDSTSISIYSDDFTEKTEDKLMSFLFPVSEDFNSGIWKDSKFARFPWEL